MSGEIAPTSPPERPGTPQLVRRPLVLAAFGYCLGALIPGTDLAGTLILTGSLVAITAFLAAERRVLSILLLPFAFAAAGIVTGQLRLPPEHGLGDESQLGDPLLLEGFVAEAPEVRPDGRRLILDLVGTATAPAARLSPVAGRIRIRVGATPAAQDRQSMEARCGSPGDRVRVWAKVRPLGEATFPGGFSERAVAARRGVALAAYAPGPDRCVVVERAVQGGLQVTVERLRDRIHAAIERGLPADRASVVRAFATGDRSGLTKKVEDDFTTSGLSHLLAVSGLNLAIVAGLFVVALGFLLKRVTWVSLGPGAGRVSALLAIPFVVLYTLLVGASPSAVRAGIMVLALLAAHLFVRITEAWSTLAVAVILMVAWDPTTLGDVSFQLSFAAVAGLLRVYPALRGARWLRLDKWPRGTRWIADVALASLAATIATAPLVARHFNRMSLVGLVANVPAAPIASLVLVPLSLVGGVLGTVSDLLASPFLLLAGWASLALTELAAFSSALPGASLRLPTPTILECVLVYGATIGLCVRPLRRRAVRFGIACLVLATLSLGGAQLLRRLSSEVRITFLPVGQGDAVVVELPHGHVMLVDTGPPGDGFNAADRVILPFLRNRRIPSLDLVVLTHPHADHIGGFETLAEQIPIREVWWSGDRRDAPAPMLEAIERAHPVVVSDVTEKRRYGGATVEVLAPWAAPMDYAIVNDGSVVVRVKLGERHVLLTGDAEEATERALVAREQERLPADVLKAGHHGSRTSSIEPFVEAVRPEHFVISAGARNRFGFPHRSVMERMRARGVQIWRTDQDGAVTVRMHGDTVEVQGFLRDPKPR